MELFSSPQALGNQLLREIYWEKEHIHSAKEQYTLRLASPLNNEISSGLPKLCHQSQTVNGSYWVLNKQHQINTDFC